MTPSTGKCLRVIQWNFQNTYIFVDLKVVANFGDTCIDRDVKRGSLVLADGTVFEG